ncbi:MAG: DUF4097 family beta strand repeat-containing protein [Planctomycetota bacterium]|jgi:hypothetical protein
MRTNSYRVALGTVVLGLVGCSGAGTRSWNPDSWSYRTDTDDPITLQVAAPVAIDVESFNGNVVINADELLTALTVTVTREARHGYGRKDEADASLAEIDYTVELVPGKLGQILEIRTWSTHAEPYFQRAHVQIDLPVADGVFVRTQRGIVYATNIEGTVDIVTTQGDVRVMTNLPMRREVTITNQEGDIDYRVRGESTGALDCEAIRGQVDQRVQYGRLIVHPPTDHDTLLATLNYGENPIRLRTVDGDIRVAVVQDPTHVGTFIFEP